MIFEILFILCMFIWLLSLLPQAAPYAWASSWIAWFAVLFLGLQIYVGGGRLV